jgi:hypothetical protein
MTDRLINSYDTSSNVTVNYFSDLSGNIEVPCIVDISNCLTISDMLKNIENFRNSNYNSPNVDIITSFNTENTIEIAKNNSNIYNRGYFDYDSITITSNINYNNNLYIKNELFVKGNITAFSTYSSSDSNLKYDIYDIKNSLEKVEKLRPVSFKWKSTDSYEVGFIANELEEIFPGLIKENEYKMIRENKLIPYLIDSIKTLKNRITQIKNVNRKQLPE